jgi:uncharacterized protein YjeT (DUF2065 family)
MDGMHFYQRLPLFGTGLALGIWLVALHLFLLAKSTTSQGFLKRFPRNHTIGQVLLAIGMLWFWLLVAPETGPFGRLAMDLGEFNNAKPWMRIITPAALVLVAISVKEFLAVRALGLCGLMLAAPLLGAAFLKDPQSRLLIPAFCYALIVASLFFVGMPYLFRDAVTWATASSKRWTSLCGAGLLYGLAIVACAFAFWRGH